MHTSYLIKKLKKSLFEFLWLCYLIELWIARVIKCYTRFLWENDMYHLLHRDQCTWWPVYLQFRANKLLALLSENCVPTQDNLIIFLLFFILLCLFLLFSFMQFACRCLCFLLVWFIFNAWKVLGMVFHTSMYPFLFHLWYTDTIRVSDTTRIWYVDTFILKIIEHDTW